MKVKGGEREGEGKGEREGEGEGRASLITHQVSEHVVSQRINI